MNRNPVTLVMGRLPATTGGERYDVAVVGALGRPVRHVYVGLWQACTLVGLLPGVGPALAALPISLVLMLRRGLFVVDEHFAGTVALAGWVRRVLGRGRTVAVVHHLEGPPTTAWRRWWQRWRLGMADAICTVSAGNARELAAAGLDPRRIRVIPPGLERPAAAPRERSPSAPPRVLAVGGASWRKGYDLLLDALTLLAPGQELHLDVAGDPGPRWLRARLHRLARRLPPHVTVTFHARPSAEALGALYAAADLFVWPSRREGFGLVLAEAMAHGLPIVATDTGAARELVGETGSGLVVPVGDVRALAAALSSLLASPPARARHRVAGLRWADTADLTWSRARAAFADLVKALEP